MHPGQGHLAAAFFAMTVTAPLLFFPLPIISGEEERLRALQHVCFALPRTAQALSNHVRPLSYARADWDAAGARRLQLHVKTLTAHVLSAGGWPSRGGDQLTAGAASSRECQ